MRFMRPILALQLGQEWTTSLQLVMQNGIQQMNQVIRIKNPTPKSIPKMSQVSPPLTYSVVVVTSAWQLGHVVRTGTSPNP